MESNNETIIKVKKPQSEALNRAKAILLEEET